MVVEFDETTKKQVSEIFSSLRSPVTLHVFIRDHSCLYCNDTREIAQQVGALSDKIRVEIHKGELKQSPAKEMGIRFTPAIMIQGAVPYKIRFYGIPAGHEFGALIWSIVDASKGTVELPADIIDDIRSIRSAVHIQVFTTPQCPYCPGMVRLAHQAAILNQNIEADMIEALEFQDLANKYQVYGVPKTIFNESVSVEGLTPPEMFVEKLFEATEK